MSRKIVFFQFFCMIFLVFVHSYNLQEQIPFPYSQVSESLTVTSFTEHLFINSLLRFRLPLLFIISGYLFALQDAKPFIVRIKKRIKSLLIPYLLWSSFGIVFNYVVFFIIQTFSLHSYFPAFHKVHFQGYSHFLNTLILNPISFQLWYLKVLFLLNLLYPVISLGLKYLPVVVFIGSGVMWLLSEKMNLLQGEGLFFFCLGVWFCKKQINVQEKPVWLNTEIGFVFFFLIAILKTFLMFNSHFLPGTTFAKYVLIFLYRAIEVSGLIVAWFGMDKIVEYFINNKYFQKWNTYSFFIYALHAPLCIYLMDFLLTITTGFQYHRIVCFIICPTISVILCIISASIFKKVSPHLYRIATGSRGPSHKSEEKEKRLASMKLLPAT